MEVASDKQASDILMLDVGQVATFADYLVIMSAESIPQMTTLAEEMRMELKRQNVRLHHQEGTPSSGWLLLDFSDVIVHVFAPEEREFYGLEQVWRAARPVIRIQ